MQNYPPRSQQLSPSSFSSPPIVTLSDHHHLHHPSYQPVSLITTTTLNEGDLPSLILDNPSDHMTTFPSSPPADPLPLLFQGHRPVSFSSASSSSGLSVGSIETFSDHHSNSLRPRSASPRFGSSGNGGSGGGGFRQKLLRPFSRSSREGSKKKLMMTNSSGVNVEGGDGGGGERCHANAAFDYESLDDIHADELISTATATTPTIPPLITIARVEAAVSRSGALAAAPEGKMYEVNLHSGHEEEVVVVHNHDHHHDHHHHHNHSGHDQLDHQGHHSHQGDHSGHSSSTDHHHHNNHHSHHHPHHHDHHDHKAVSNGQLLKRSNHHCHDNSMERAQAEQARQAMTKLIIGLLLCLTFMLVELIGGWLSQSLAIFTDAAHLTSDLVSFLISLLAIYFGQRRPTRAMSFGYFRFEVLGVLLSVASIWVLTAVLLYFACHRIVYQQFEIESTTMLVVSSIGLGMNILMMLVLSGGLTSAAKALAGFFCCAKKGSDKEKKNVPSVGVHNGGHVQLEQQEGVVAVPTTPGEDRRGGSFDFEHGHGDHGHGHGHEHSSHAHAHSHGFGGHGHSHMNMNVRAALLHIVGDIIQSVGVLVAALVIHFWPHLKLADPICTLIFGVIVFATTYRILADTLHILMEGFPRELPLQYEAVRGLLLERLKSLGVVGVHSLHVWALTHGRNALTVHLTVGRRKKKEEGDGGDESEHVEGSSNDAHFEAIRVAAERVIRAELSIAQTTIQVEYSQQMEVSGGENDGGGEACDTCVGPKS